MYGMMFRTCLTVFRNLIEFIRFLFQDGTPTLRLNEYMLASLAAGKINFGEPEVRAEGVEQPKEIKFELDQKTEAYIKEAERDFDDLVGKHELLVSVSRDKVDPSGGEIIVKSSYWTGSSL